MVSTRATDRTARTLSAARVVWGAVAADHDLIAAEFAGCVETENVTQIQENAVVQTERVWSAWFQ